jgi:superfamily II DNA/RNA helicase
MAPNDGEKRDPRAWDALTPPLTEWILDAISSMGFLRMTPVQASTIPLFMGNKDSCRGLAPFTDVAYRQLLNLLPLGSDR